MIGQQGLTWPALRLRFPLQQTEERRVQVARRTREYSGPLHPVAHEPDEKAWLGNTPATAPRTLRASGDPQYDLPRDKKVEGADCMWECTIELEESKAKTAKKGKTKG